MDQEGFWYKVVAVVRQYPGRVIGAGGGLLAGVSLIWLGLWKTLILGLFTAVGYCIGRWSDDEGKGLREFLEEKLPGRPDFH